MWKFQLVKDMKDPAKLVFSDDRVAVLRDSYPKAERHFLVLPQEDISNLTQVKQDDVKLLKYMDQKGRDIAEEYGGGRTFKFGYHAAPSMDRLHLHVISDDMNSPSLKYKKHWNSFTTPFFLDSSKVIKDLEISGKVEIPTESEIKEFLGRPLKCQQCGCTLKTIPALKNHISEHL